MLWAGDLRWGEGRVDGVQTSSLRRPHAQSRARVSEPEPETLRTLASHHSLAGETTGAHWPAPAPLMWLSLWPGIITQGQWDSPQSPPLILIVCIPSLERALRERVSKGKTLHTKGGGAIVHIYVNANDYPQKINICVNPWCFATLRKLDKLLIRQNKRCLTMANFLLVKPKLEENLF